MTRLRFRIVNTSAVLESTSKMICSHISGKNNKNKPRLYSLWRDIMNECGFVIEYLDIIPVTIQIMAYTSLCLSVSDCRVNVLMKERKKKKRAT